MLAILLRHHPQTYTSPAWLAVVGLLLIILVLILLRSVRRSNRVARQMTGEEKRKGNGRS